MRLSIIPLVGLVNIDGIAYKGLDLSFFQPNINAIQWKDNEGEVEIYDPNTGKMLTNEKITDISNIYEQVLPLWQAAKDAEDALIANSINNAN